MSNSNISYYYHIPCRFRLRSGKEVYGVVWQGGIGAASHLFASLREYEKYQEAEKDHDLNACKRLALRVDIDDFVHAESLEVLT